jgi:hypothetical protein
LTTDPSPFAGKRAWRKPLNVGGDSVDDKDQTQRQPEVERLYRTNREQLFRFLWRVRPWFNNNTATAAETVHLYIYGRIAKYSIGL